MNNLRILRPNAKHQIPVIYAISSGVYETFDFKLNKSRERLLFRRLRRANGRRKKYLVFALGKCLRKNRTGPLPAQVHSCTRGRAA